MGGRLVCKVDGLTEVIKGGYMRKLVVFLVSILVIIGSLTVSSGSVEAEDTIYLENPIVRLDLPEGIGSEHIQFKMGNRSDSERVYTIELSNDYTTRDADEVPLDPSWFTFCEVITLPVGSNAYMNVDFSIPSPVPDAKYMGWFRIYDTPWTQDKYIPVLIRTGSAIPKYDFMIRGSTVFTVPVWGPRETQTTDKISFRIANTGSASSRYWVYPRAPDTFTKAGVAYDYLPVCREWVDFKSCVFSDYPSYSLTDHPEVVIANKNGTRPNNKLQSLLVSVDAYTEQTIIVPLKVPADAKNGLYTIFLQVNDVGPIDPEDSAGMGLNEAYAIKIFFELDRQGEPVKSFWGSFGVIWILVGALIIAVVFAFIVWPFIQEKRSQSKEATGQIRFGK